MKNQLVILITLCSFAFTLTSCEKVELLESPMITLSSPASGATYKVNDEIPIIASIDSDNSTIKSYSLEVKYKKGGKELQGSYWSAESDQSLVDIDTKYVNDREVNKAVIVEVCADLIDNTTTCQNVEIKFEK